MEYRFPKWLSPAMVCVIASLTALTTYAFATSAFAGGPTYKASIASVVILVFGLLLWADRYIRRYSIRIDDEALSITSAFHTKNIPLRSIEQVVMAAAPRSGMACLLVDHTDAVIAKIDSGVVGFDSLINDLGKALRPYKILFYKREVLGAWQMQVAGDSNWAPYPAPPLVLKQTRRFRYLMAYAFIVLALAIGLAKLADNGALDGILGM